jgi:GTP-binding protein
VTIRGGKGGSGSSAFAGSRSGGLGPPSGGDGASGSSIYLMTSPHLSDLSTVGKRGIGLQGGNGSGSWRHGRRPLDVTIRVPIGTVVREIKREDDKERWEADFRELPKEERQKRWRERWFVKHPSGEISDPDYHHAFDILERKGHLDTPLASSTNHDGFYLDITSPITKPILLTRGGKGGLGNPHFHIPAAQTPSRLASRGVQPPTYTFEFELKLLADVGLVGFPNAGKSTILRGLTGRKAEVAGYSFTTLNPQIGVVRVYEDGTWASGGGGVIEESEIEREKEQEVWDTGDYVPAPEKEGRRVEQNRFTISDNPGLLPQASANVGLGHTFLRHLERCLVHVYVLDLTRPDPMADLNVLREEMEAWQKGLSKREAVVVLNKGDEVDEETGRARVESVQEGVKAERQGWEVVVVSAKYGLGLDKLVQTLSNQVAEKKYQLKLDSDPATKPSGFGLKRL